MSIRTLTALAGTLALAHIGAQVPAESPEYSPHADESFPMQVFWGDTHVHSSFSMDAVVSDHAEFMGLHFADLVHAVISMRRARRTE